MRAIKKTRLLLAATLALLPAGAAAQLRPGDHARIALRGAPWQVGTVVSATADTVVLESLDHATTAIALASARRVEVGQRESGKQAFWRGARTGGMVGMVMGAVVGLATDSDPPAPQKTECPAEAWACERNHAFSGFDMGPGAKVMGGAVVGAALGFVAGGAIEASHHATHWRKVELRAAPTGRGAAIGLTLQP